jgi:NAD(P)H-hydrate epimerase
MNLPIVSCAEMRRIEEQTFATGITAESLMEKVGAQIAQAVVEFVPRPGVAHIFYGKGHNGGDALVAARHLTMGGWGIELHAQEADPSKLAELTARHLAALHSVRMNARPSRDPRSRPIVVIDGLLGLGASGPLREDIRSLTRQINALHEQENARVFAVDIPTGLDGDTGAADPDCVIADVTITAGFAKNGLVADSAPDYVGRLCVAALPEFTPPAEYSAEVATPDALRGLLKRRRFDSHKGLYGRVAIIAGSPGFTGAAILCANGALRAGAGLVTIYAPEEIQSILAIKAPAEVMVRPVKSYAEVLEEKHDVVALGPGLGKERAGAVLQLIEHCASPMVLDADGLNIVAEHEPPLLMRCAGPRLLTPHPGEMARLFPESKSLSRHDAAAQFIDRHAATAQPLTLLLKGSRTIIHEQGKPFSYNTTGNPGMSTGGMGDVLTGVCAALIGQGLAPYDAARLGAWLCGHAAELAVASGCAEQSLAATDVLHLLASAFTHLQTGCL